MKIESPLHIALHYFKNIINYRCITNFTIAFTLGLNVITLKFKQHNLNGITDVHIVWQA